MQYAINARGLVKSYHTKACAVPVLSGVNLCVPCGAFVSIAGPSGCGKSTLLSILGCLDLADAGELSLLGQDVMNASERVLCTLRREQLGFVFQSYNLVPSLSALSNVELPLKYRGVPAVLRREL
ncbi:MAG: ATP-binding cassette domain-containing protein, partial [Pygmaiobacter sp.]